MSVRYHFRVLDAAASVEGPAPVLDPIAAAYARFRTEEPGTAPISIRVAEGGDLVVEGRRISPVRGIEPTLVVYERFLQSLMERFERHAVLHAAALEDGRGGVLLITAPAGFGKTSLTLELVRRGHRFLSDDFAPLDPERGEIAPYPRTVGIIPDGTAPIPEMFRRAAADPATPRILGKAAVDVGRVVGEQRVVERPLPLRHVVVLVPRPGMAVDEPIDLWMDMLVRSSAAMRLERMLQALRGARIHRRQDHATYQRWLVRLDKEVLPKRQLHELLEDEGVIAAQRYGDTRPDFASEPRAERISRRATSLALAREMLNRSRQSRFMDRYGGNDTLMWLDLAGAVGAPDVSCWSLSVGRLGRTADVVQKLLERGPEGTAAAGG